ncbi:MAG: hypothetical protein J07HQW2_02376 [Haloquadratum walsbyi J07HQW2]|uniref:Uncharacterized protein n=1 Tax=Haloquadratum walsbyi J07HQW2 TaxID=1238425 RepID=U1PU78_9EURY|nr:MAG: hypothetical protein J07HQW2_02376 [Haloquadratum walsbyi J07HQW2]
MEFLVVVSTLTPVPRLAVIVLIFTITNLTQLTDGDAVLNDVCREDVQEVVFRPGQLLTDTKRTS